MVRQYTRKRISPRCTINVDLRKAFDSVSWTFLSQVLHGYGFPPIFIAWIMECVSTSSFSVALNGSLHGFFAGKKGLRQGDPMSPGLFLLCMEYFSRLIKRKTTDSDFNFHPKCEKLKITHLLFADDLMMFSRGDLPSVHILMECLQEFRDVSGLAVNTSKSSIFTAGIENNMLCDILARTEFTRGEMPVRYLGIPLAAQRLSVRDYSPLVDQIANNISRWAAKSLSFAGRLELIRSVIHGVECFWLQIFPLPTTVIEKIHRLCRNFLWNSKRAPVAWENICHPKNEGGLGIRHTQTWNVALLTRVLWNIHRKADTLWVQWVDAVYLKGGSVWDWQPKKGDSPLLQRLAEIRSRIITDFGSSKAAIQHIAGWSNSKGLDTSKAYEYFRPKRAKQPWQTIIWKAFIPPNTVMTHVLHTHWLQFLTLAEIGVSKTSGIIGSSYWPVAGIGTSLSVQQQLFVLLRRSLKRAESLKLKRLVASIHLEIAKYDIMHVQRPLLSFGPKASMKLRTHPANVYKELWSSSHLINEFGEESSLMTTDGAFCTAWLKSLKKPMGSLIFAQENDTQSSSDAFEFIAQPSSIPGSVLHAPLARINALVFATCFADSSSLSDAALAYSKLIQHLAVYKGYKDAFAAMRIAEEKFMCVSRSRILLVKLQVLHECALHRGHLKLAQQFCDELGVLASCVTGVDMELKTEASLRHARTLLSANQYSQAAAVAHSLFCTCYKFNLQVKNATVLLLLAEIHKLMLRKHSSAGAALCLLHLMYFSLLEIQFFLFIGFRASGTLTLAELWLSLGSNHAKKALALLHSSFPVLLGHGGLELRSRAFITEAKCYLADPSFSVSDNPEMVLEPLRQASEELQLLEYNELAAEAFYLMAIVYNKLGQLDEREEAASSFRKHITAFENPEDMDASGYGTL
ncbi:Anaphase-promoting complex subunit [Sesamum angolense]|uniref:Anaphase-promoting complex subunit n=1 Tax=Sesamum angolense TaxID=2727404 RepID=A0AAE2BU81_9LAMI|nr:Anaphase-promoting complex subunit [Sesamum angolense]